MPVSPDTGAFVRDLVHDMINPMSSLVGFLDMLLSPAAKDPLTHKQHRMLVAMDRASTHFLGMLRDISDISKIEEGDWKPSKTPVNAHAVAQRVFDGYGVLAENRRISLHIDPPAEPLILSADEYMLERFLDVLLRAAGRLTAEGGGIRLALSAEGTGMVGSLEHSGDSRPREMYEAAFNASLSGPRPAEGYAVIGLALARRIALLHGGTVEAVPRPEGGARFLFRFP